MTQGEGGEGLCESLRDTLARLLRGTGLSPSDVKRIDLDPYGPRIIIEAEPQWAARISLDASPDGVEATLALAAPRGLDPLEAEEAILEAIEEAPGTDTLDEYDAGYDPEEGEIVAELRAARLTHLPSLRELAARITDAVRRLKEEG